MLTSTNADDYYPFGLEINHTVSSPKNEYLYNKKELQEELGLYDYEHRFLDPVIGRFTTIDRLAEVPEQINLSTYAYVGNNPIEKTDPYGDCPVCVVWAIVEVVEALTATDVVATAGFAVRATAITMHTIHNSSIIPVMSRDQNLQPLPVQKPLHLKTE